MSAPGWYPDPQGSGQPHYWDGSTWAPGPKKQSPWTRPPVIAGVAIVCVALLGGVIAMVKWQAPDRVATPSAPPVVPLPTIERTLPSKLARPAVCQEAPAKIVDVINSGFTDGQHLEDAQALDGPDASTYVAGSIIRPDGSPDASYEAWIYLKGVAYVLTENARVLGRFREGRDVAPIDFYSDEYERLANCITNVGRLRDGKPPLPLLPMR
jgi:hypothetical protein